MKRVFLFIVTNLAVLLVLSFTLSLLGVESSLQANGVDLNFQALLIISGVIGMGGSFISLAISKWMAKRMTGAQVIEDPRNDSEAWLLETVRQQAQAANIGMPTVAVFPSDQPNAFATGARRNSALVAVSSGLLQRMDRGEVEAVLAHEVSHVANGDMITLTLIQGVVNTFVIFLSRVAGHFIDRVVLKNERGHGIGYFVSVIICQIVFGILATPIVMWFSRRREFRADAGGARLAGTQKMVGALEALRRVAEPEPLPDQMAAFGIAGVRGAGLRALWMSHPPLEERIEALKQAPV
jgi:heat shock protein HtpX